MLTQQVQQAQVADRPVRRTQEWRVWAFVLALFAIAIALRVANLTAQSLWADEGNSVRLTERPLYLVMDAARADVHPPGYYLLLWGWAKLFGQGEAAMRALSVTLGTLVVGLVYLLAQQLFNPRSAWLAAFCAAVSPFQIVYSQEVRMYILLAVWGTVVAYAFVRWLEASEKRSWLRWGIVYTVGAAAGLWTHYSFPIVLIALNVAWLVWWIGKRGEGSWLPSLMWWVGAQLATLILYLPWLPTAWSKALGYGAISEQHSALFIVGQALKLFSVGETVPDDEWTRWLTVGIVGLAVFGAWSGLMPTQPSRPHKLSVVQTLALILLVLAPVALMVALTLTGRPAYRPKFFLVASPAFCILVGEGIALLEQTTGQKRGWGSRLWLLVGLGLVAAGAGRSLRNYYENPAYARSDYRGIARLIAETGREGDAILLNAPNQWEVFTYYYPEGPGHAPVYPLCRARPPVEAEVVAELEAIVARHGRLFVLYWAAEQSDPERIVERWLEAHTFKAADTWYGDVRLAIYAVPDKTWSHQDLGAAKMAHPLSDVRLGQAIALRGYTLISDKVGRGDILQVILFWQALDVPAERYKVFLHLLNTDGQIVSQFDGEPGGGLNVTTSWRPDQGLVADRYGVLVPLTAAAGEYRLLMGMYHISGAPRLPISRDGMPAGDAFTLATIQVN